MEFWRQRVILTMICTAPLRMEASSFKTTRPPTSETSTLNVDREPRRILAIEQALAAGSSAQRSEPDDRGANCGVIDGPSPKRPVSHAAPPDPLGQILSNFWGLAFAG